MIDTKMCHGRWGLLGFVLLLTAGLENRVMAETPLARPLLQQQHAAAQRAVRLLERSAQRQLAVVWPAHRARPTMIRGLSLHIAGATPSARALSFVRRFPDLFAGVGGQLRVARTRETTDRQVVILQQHHGAVPVDGSEALLTFDRKGHLIAIHSTVEPFSPTPTRRRLSIAQALSRVAAATGRRFSAAERALQQSKARLAFFKLEQRGRLAFRILWPSQGRRPLVAFVDASTGGLLGVAVAVGGPR